MKPSAQYAVVKAQVLATHPGIKDPHLTEKALLTLLDQLFKEPEAKQPAPLPPLNAPLHTREPGLGVERK